MLTWTPTFPPCPTGQRHSQLAGLYLQFVLRHGLCAACALRWVRTGPRRQTARSNPLHGRIKPIDCPAEKRQSQESWKIGFITHTCCWPCKVLTWHFAQIKRNTDWGTPEDTEASHFWLGYVCPKSVKYYIKHPNKYEWKDMEKVNCIHKTTKCQTKWQLQTM